MRLIDADDMKKHLSGNDEGIKIIKEWINEQPTIEPTLYGYKIEYLAFIAKVMQKEGITPEYAVRSFNDMSRVIRMIIEDTQKRAEEMLYEYYHN